MRGKSFLMLILLFPMFIGGCSESPPRDSHNKMEINFILPVQMTKVWLKKAMYSEDHTWDICTSKSIIANERAYVKTIDKTYADIKISGKSHYSFVAILGDEAVAGVESGATTVIKYLIFVSGTRGGGGAMKVTMNGVGGYDVSDLPNEWFAN